MFLTNPEELGPFGITAWFMALLVLLTAGSTLGVTRLRRDRSKSGFLRTVRRSFLISLWIVALLALGSLRQLTIGDIILITVLVVAIDFYMRRVQQ